MQYRIYKRQTLEYVDGGYVQNFSIDDDYIVNKNSTISVVKKIAPIIKKQTQTIRVSGTYNIGIGNTIIDIIVGSGNAIIDSYTGSEYAITVTGIAEITIIYEIKDTLSNVVAGDFIALIQDSGAYHKGVITAVDDTALKITYSGDKELFNDNVLNPLIADYTDKDKAVDRPFGVDIVVWLLEKHFVNTGDKLKDLPIIFVTDGDVLDEDGKPKMLWTWSNDSINTADWLTELFEKYSLSLDLEIDFDTSKDLTISRKNSDGSENLNARHPEYICTLSAITKSGGIIKDNVAMQTLTYTVKGLPDATVCKVLESSDKSLLGTFYLYKKDDEYSVSAENDYALSDGRKRVFPVKSVIATRTQSSDTTNTVSAEDVARDKLVPSQFNQAIEIKINSDSKMFDFANAKFGNQYQIINEQGAVNSILTGKKLTSGSKWVTLYFGLGRQTFTDWALLKFRKQHELGIGQNGKDGKNGQDGTNGTNGTDGKDGTDGKSAYEIAVEEGFKGTEEEWLESLKGDPGDKGDKGDPGDKGDKGDPGDKGDKGDPGNSIVNIVPNGQDENGGNIYTIILSDGTSYNIVAPKGDSVPVIVPVQGPYETDVTISFEELIVEFTIKTDTFYTIQVSGLSNNSDMLNAFSILSQVVWAWQAENSAQYYAATGYDSVVTGAVGDIRTVFGFAAQFGLRYRFYVYTTNSAGAEAHGLIDFEHPPESLGRGYVRISSKTN